MNPFAAMSDEDVLTRFYNEENDDRADLAFTELDYVCAGEDRPARRGAGNGTVRSRECMAPD